MASGRPSVDRLAADHRKHNPVAGRRQGGQAALILRVIRGDRGEYQGLEVVHA